MAKVVIAGGGLGGALAAKLLEDSAEVTLVDSKDYFEVRWAELRGFVEPAVATKIVVPHKEYLKKATVKVGKITTTTAEAVTLEDGTSVPFDFLVIATGSKADKYTTTGGKLDHFKEEHTKIAAAKSVLIVGGGPVGVELAGEIVTDFPDTKVTIVHSGSRLIEFLQEKASAKALKWLQSKNVEIIFNDRVELSAGHEPGTTSYSTRNGKEITADYLFLATGSRPDSSWLKDTFGGVLEEDGRVKVDSVLRVEGFSNVFAIGDITNIKEAKQGYFAQIHARQTAANIKKLIADPKATGLKTYKAGPNVGLVSLGRKQGLAQFPFATFTGFLPTMIKSKELFVPKVRQELGLAK